MQIVKQLWNDWLKPILPVIAIIIPLRSSIADYNPVPTGSMNPTILEGDLVFIHKAAYDLRVPLTKIRIARWGLPKRGDIVVCFSPTDNTRLVKRVIGLPGDTLMINDNQLRINNSPVQYTKQALKITSDLPLIRRQQGEIVYEQLDSKLHPVLLLRYLDTSKQFGPIIIPENQYFMMGDNRNNSLDSRYFGCIKQDQIIGRAVGVIGSLNILDKWQPRWNRFFSKLD